MLKIDSLNVHFSTPDGPVWAVRDLNLQVNPGEVLGIVGESGSGKSQTWMAPLGLLADNAQVSGHVWFDDRDLLQLDVGALNQIRGNRIAMVFQDPMTSLNPYLKIGLQLCEALRIHNPGLGRAEARRQCIDMLDRVAIPQAAERFNAFPHELSGGMRQRVMIAMALLNRPDVLIADEPTTALDVTIQAEILNLMSQLQRDMGMAVVFITHDLGLVANLCDRVAVMYAGQIIEQGRTQDVLNQGRHPYTLSLMNAVPRMGEAAGGRLYNIPGVPPDLKLPPMGCPFAPRCFAAEEKCKCEAPEARETQDGQIYSCHRDEDPSTLKTMMKQAA